MTTRVIPLEDVLRKAPHDPLHCEMVIGGPCTCGSEARIRKLHAQGVFTVTEDRPGPNVRAVTR